ncbi:MAG: EVE domain-containing protein [Deltaproteobacteria bacterium CG_4_10_14_0_2_um_filter_43_8]|nr:MAG: EVE domain-containing protein [Deltaproteobacteria bacterium CG11_big_fil_rev_8_21_14_0_20_42_23]PJA21349.1 MAG: EVE domain-containing protein [Deltaproteobacteria bacterium CG_4_10_14_0_2_um_filter_43_8]PJC64809.1 MAG: EVE domain-containing protein [Deltaproteobacteria bacterium CG_4_9_14_0_2_um_filter_42_21]
MKYWLMKSEPSTYSIDDLKRDKKTAWEGVRNYQARNFMRDHMKRGDHVLFYHSNATPPALVGLATVCKESYPDPSQFDPRNKYFDQKATPEKPIWYLVDICFEEKFETPLSLEQIKNIRGLEKMLVVQKGSRLSVQPVEKKHFEHIVTMLSKHKGK